MNKVVFDFDANQTSFQTDGTISNRVLTERLACSLRQLMGEDRCACNAVLAAACDYAAAKGINLVEMMKDFFPDGYRPSKY